MLGVFNLRIMKDRNEYLKSVKNGTHKQFLYSEEKEKVVCKCGHSAVWFRTAFLCGTKTDNIKKLTDKI